MDTNTDFIACKQTAFQQLFSNKGLRKQLSRQICDDWRKEGYDFSTLFFSFSLPDIVVLHVITPLLSTFSMLNIEILGDTIHVKITRCELVPW